MNPIVENAINSVNSGIISFCRFITANDTGITDSHQSGFYIPKIAYNLFFDSQGVRGGNAEKFIKIKWQDDFETDSRAIYYGQGTRNEYRLTRFGRDFPLLKEEYTGGLLIITKISNDYYQGYVLNEDEDIEYFLDVFGMTPADTNTLIKNGSRVFSADIEGLMNTYLASLPKDFPDTKNIAEEARNISTKLTNTVPEMVIKEPDKAIVNWLQTEYELFKKIEIHYYSNRLSSLFHSVDDFVEMAHTVINRRMSRAGKSLEHHLAATFNINKLLFDNPGKTEGNKKPDFIFPGNNKYHDSKFTSSKLVFLGAKTTCKDRWRQILNEATRITTKHLFTLQQGISKNQLKEMYDSNVVLVVPQQYISTYPEEFREKILDLSTFINFAKHKQDE